jgi:hypothetical protein
MSTYQIIVALACIAAFAPLKDEVYGQEAQTGNRESESEPSQNSLKVYYSPAVYIGSAS